MDEDIIKVYYYKTIDVLCQNLIDVALERGRRIDQSKRHHLVLKMAIVGFEGYFSFIAFSELHLIVGMGQIKLGKMLSPTYSIQLFSNQR